MDTLVSLSPTFPTFFILFLSVYLFAYFVVFRTWGSKPRREASSSFMSLAHGTPAILMAIKALFPAQTPLAFASPNTSLDNRVLEFSMAYFLMDLLHYLLFFPRDILFILHHLATLYVIVTCRYMVHYGASGILVVLVLGEVTSCCQNVWSIARFGIDDVPAAAKLQDFLALPFYSFYSIVRGIVGPLYVFRMVGFYLSGAATGLIPGWAWVSWMVVVGTAIWGSMLWISHHWIDWFRGRSHDTQKKER